MRFIFVLFSLMLATPAFSATPPEDAADIARIETYLNDITTLRARFLQVAPDGGMAEGSLALKRPGRMRFEYDPPAQIEVVADGLFVHYHDKELKQVTAVPISTTPLAVLLDDKVVLDGSNDGIVVTALERRPGLIAATVADKDDLGNGSVTLIFSDQPLQLRQWVVHDAQGLSTKLTLFDARRGVSLENGDFYFANPYTAGGGGGN
tara:strand:+ start:15268 stop:15888 length:621 start_codon:yes stop_codon:yes gene_type:complete